jgi:hypothetical protein
LIIFGNIKTRFIALSSGLKTKSIAVKAVFLVSLPSDCGKGGRTLLIERRLKNQNHWIPALPAPF